MLALATTVTALTYFDAGDFMKAVGASGRVFELLEREPKVNYKGGQSADATFGAIELHNVDFSYPSRVDHPVLRGLSLEVKPGTVVALVGPSGGGKSTVFQLIERFYLPTCKQPTAPSHSSITHNTTATPRSIGILGSTNAVAAGHRARCLNVCTV